MKLNAIASIPKLVFGSANNQNEHAHFPDRADSIFDSKMAMVPAGETRLLNFENESEVHRHNIVYVDSFMIDRFAVTNSQFAEFVKGGGYANMKLWPKEVWSHVLQFVDATGKPGPRFWENGRPKKHLLQHPVVGICWFEANAYAKWSGKRLPTSSQWQRAGTWAGEGTQDSAQYPWQGGFQASKANIWISGIHHTVEVDQHYEGCTPNGVCQLIGNVWEWVGSKFSIHDPQQSEHVKSNLAEIRGGAFNTYLESQATCLFRTGQSFLFRNNNVGFRCCKEKA